MFGNLFKKKVTIVDTRNKEQADHIAARLKEAGVWVNLYEEHPQLVLGGAHMNSADWSGKFLEKGKDAERITYHIEILQEQTGRARQVLADELE